MKKNKDYSTKIARFYGRIKKNAILSRYKKAKMARFKNNKDYSTKIALFYGRIIKKQ